MPTPLDDGTTLFDIDAYTERRNLAGRFVVPPLTVIDQAQGYMRQRRTQWEAAFPDALGRHDFATREETVGGRSGDAGRTDAVGLRLQASGPTVSVFDPTIAEIAYEWWTAPGDLVYDPFSGGPPRGVVATAMGRRYVGVDVRREQIAHNLTLAPAATYVCADSTEYLSPPSDFVFSCPPYGSWERYSDLPEDLSTMSWRAFSAAYREVIELAVYTLRPNRFAAFMVGNYKEKRVLRDVVGLTVDDRPVHRRRRVRRARHARGRLDLIFSSPPFLALRSYLPADHPDKAKRSAASRPPPTSSTRSSTSSKPATGCSPRTAPSVSSSATRTPVRVAQAATRSRRGYPLRSEPVRSRDGRDDPSRQRQHERQRSAKAKVGRSRSPCA
jgi:hypothetical protein